MPLDEYKRKRHFAKTPEPGAKVAPKKRGKSAKLSFVVQKHAASRLHYDFRLEHEGVLLSWAVPKGPSLDPGQKRLAVRVEDHPLAYAGFEGVIPEGEYGGGSVIVWDRGTWEPEGEPAEMLDAGRLRFALAGEKLRGTWNLVRTRDEKTWLLMKSKDAEAVPLAKGDVLSERAESVLSGRTVEEVGESPERVWKGGKSHKASSPKAAKKTATGKAVKRKPIAKKGQKRKSSSAKATKPKSRKPRSVERRVRSVRIADAKPAPLPATISPQLATLAERVPAGAGWVHEVKYDGYRLLCRVEAGKAKVFTRNGHDWTHKFPEIAEAAADLPVESAWIDGEAVVAGEDGRPAGFSALQKALSEKDTRHVVFCAFDLPYLDGFDLRPAALADRKAALARLLKAAPKRLRYVEHFEGDGEAFYRECVAAGLEGIICKRSDAPYRGERSPSWLKVKGVETGEFVVGGFTEPKGSRAGVGALLLGEHDAGGLRYVGRVGTGFDARLLTALRGRLERLEQKACPFSSKPANARSGVRWVRPEIVVQVASTERTADGILRHARFEGFREDKAADEVTSAPGRGRAMPSKTTTKRSRTSRPPASKKGRVESLSKEAAGQIASVKVTHPDRVLFPAAGLTKADLVAYYASVADWVLPHVAGRPLSLVRCPEGAAGGCFFQRHAGPAVPKQVERLPIDGEEKDHLVVRDLAGLAALVQMGVLELHVWGAKADKPDRPDRLTFDLDPGEGVPFAEVSETALLVRDRLAALGLESWVKTTGGKGLHVVAPLDRRHEWDEVKDFAKRFAARLAADLPKRFLAKSNKAARRGRIYVDYLRNDRTATAVAAYSTRARDDAPVSTPLAWEELGGGLDPKSLTIATVPDRLASLDADPWEEMTSTRQSLTAAARRDVSRAGG
jgi:bifunctional non-homologous end joining protein LigD